LIAFALALTAAAWQTTKRRAAASTPRHLAFFQ